MTVTKNEWKAVEQTEEAGRKLRELDQQLEAIHYDPEGITEDGNKKLDSIIELVDQALKTANEICAEIYDEYQEQ